MTIGEVLKKYHNYIEWLDTQALLAHVLDKPREFLITHEDAHVPLFKQLKFRRLITKRKSGVPIAYLTEHKEFFGLDFLVNKHTLVPRPDTEILVETAVSRITYHITHNNPVTLVDVGTGSGCIPISIQKTIQQYQPKAGQPVADSNTAIPTYAIDISKQALKVAKKNAKIHHTNITFLHGNLLNPFIQQYNNFRPELKSKDITIKQYSHIIITANLPYLTEEQFQTEPSIQHEPKFALVAEKNGLALYEELLKQIVQTHTTYHIAHITCFFEIDPDQTDAIQQLIFFNLPNAQIKIIKDLAGFDRVVEIQCNTR